MSKEVTETKTVKVKIAYTARMMELIISNAGVQVEMPEKDFKYVDDTFKRMSKAQKILEKYFDKK